MSRWNLVRWVGRSGGLPLWTLFVCVATVLVMGMQWAVVARMVPQAEESVRDGIDEALLTAHDVWTRRASEHAENQASRVATIVKDQGFIETINPSVDVPGGVFGPEYRPTLLSALANLNSRAAYDAAFVLDHEGRALLQEPASLVVPPEVLTRMMAGLRARGAAPRRGKSVPAGHGLAVLGERGYRMVLLDLGTLDAQRWLLVGFRLQPELEALHTDTRVEASLQAQGRLVESTLTAAPERAALASAKAQATQFVGADHLWRIRTDGLQTVDGSALSLRLARPLDAAMAAGAAMRRDLWTASAGAMVGFALLLWAVSRHYVTASLAQLVGAARRVGARDYDASITPTGPVREVRQLAVALDQMRQDLRAEEYFDRRLTQLPNRTYFRVELEKMCAEGTPVAVLVVGLNRFKEVNRRIGYGAGDGLLREMAERLKRVVRSGDFVARLGGDLFAVMLPGLDLPEALSMARRVGHALEQPVDLMGHRVDRHAAIGVACAPIHAEQAEQLLARAEIALYAAKDRREAVLAYEAGLERQNEAHLALLSELRLAKENNELLLHLQPKVNLLTGAIAGAEALLRWQHPQRGMVPPGAFIPSAEDSPLIKELTLWVFESVVKQQSTLLARGIPCVSINLSARDLMDPALPDKLDALLRQHGACAEAICLETTESAVMADIARARQTLTQLRQQGFKLSIDDFGEGQTSMRYLKELPVHELKIDMVFVKAMLTDLRTESIVQALVDVGHAYGLSVVAEGVENAQAAQRLAQLGCDEGQGWHFAKPMPVAELLVWSQVHVAEPAAVAMA